jgi:DNA-binding phage protein
MNENLISRNEAAQAIGMSRQGLYSCLQRDDMKISQIKMMITNLGYTVTFEIEINEEVERVGINNYVNELKQITKIIKEYQTQRTDNLGFLTIALFRAGYRWKDVAEKSGVNYFTLRKNIYDDDMYFSRLLKIIEAYNLTLRITIAKTQEDNDNPEQQN